MAVLKGKPNFLTDGDAAFLRVNNLVPAHALRPGELARGANIMIENGKPRPRLGVAVDAWGVPGVNLANGFNYEVAVTDSGEATASVYAIITGLTVGVTYKLFFNEAFAMSTGIISAGGVFPTTDVVYTPGCTLEIGAEWTEVNSPYEFTATTTTIYLFQFGSLATSGAPVAAVLVRKGMATCAYERFNDPTTDTDNTILITDDWRDEAGEDGGRGRAWRIKPGYVPTEIDLNGHDVWGTARLIQCDNAIVLLRHGNERHYFDAGNISATNALNDQFPLNAAPSWAAGTAKRVTFNLVADTGESTLGQSQAITDSDLTADTITVASHGLANGTAKVVTGITGASGVYYVRSVSASTLSLYDTAAHAIAGGGTGLFDITVNDETGTLADRPPAPASVYYAKHVATNLIELYLDSALANKVLFSITSSPAAKFYIELSQVPQTFYGDGAPPLILQPDSNNTAFELGFVVVPANVAVTNSSNAADTITAPQHKLAPGDAVSAPLSTDTALAGYAYPLDADTFALYATQAAALINTGTRVAVTADSQTGYVKKTSAAGLPMPPGREGCYKNGRLIIINQLDRVLISDPYDFLHFTSFTGSVAANQGESGKATWLHPLGDDVLLVGKELKILAISGLGGAPSTWRMDEVTSEYGGIAPLAKLNVGTDVWALSRKGVASIKRTIAGERLGEARTESETIPEDLKAVDWTKAVGGCFGIWNNRFFAALPGRDQETSYNDKVLVFNFLNRNKRVDQAEVDGEIVGRIVPTDGIDDAWEGTWTGDLLRPYALVKVTVGGDERLTFATPDGEVYWFQDAWEDNGVAIEHSLKSRGYFGGRLVMMFKAALTWETHDPNIQVKANAAGYKEEWTLLDGETYDNTASTVAGGAEYDPETSTEAEFNQPRRSDYSAQAADLLVGEPNVHQNSTRQLRARIRDRGIQLTVTNTQGSLRMVGTTLQAKAVGLVGHRKV